ncbi:ABC transporter ATP-binding protein [Methanobacterium aggregans]|uniref:ABC transporter ATP-binding protein n=1 Tax=Methanobacterium aggregans TaxID=1615586 RepID=UPI0032105D80
MSQSVISTKNLTKFYKKDPGVLDLNLEVFEGEVFGYLGPNGAGKTTTIRLFLDFIRPTSGSAEIFGRDSHTEGLKIREKIGYLPGELSIYSHLTGKEFLRYMASLRGGADWEFIGELASRLKSDLSKGMGSMSHGNKQKIGLIQAFMHQPELLILDEPTMGLDPLVQQEFYKMVREVKRDGRTVFLSSHIMPEVERICDRVGIIRRGKMVAVEKIVDLKERRLRHLEIHFAEDLTPEAFEGVPGIYDVQVQGKILECSVSGSMDPLIKRISNFEVLNILSHEPSLEEVFLTYYSGDGHD